MQIEPQAPDCPYAGRYALHGLLGEGGQANVYLGTVENKLVAAKVYFPGASGDRAFERERAFLAGLNHQGLINLVEAVQNAPARLPGKTVEEHFNLLVMEFAEGRELFEYLHKGGRFPAEFCRCVLRQLLDVIAYLQNAGVAHRDIKLENMLFTGDFRLKVSDFGLSAPNAGRDGSGVLTSRVGTDGYKAPQVQAGRYSGLAADLFAAGVVLFVMFNGGPPFLSTQPHERFYRCIRDGDYPRFWAIHEKKKPGFFPPAFKELLNAMFHPDPTRRPTLEQLREDPWLSGEAASPEQMKAYMLQRFGRIYADDPLTALVAQIRQTL